MKIGTIVYLTEPVKWRKTPDGDWNEYPIGTPLRVIGDSGVRGLDLEFVETGIKMLECRFVKYSTENPIKKPKKLTKVQQLNRIFGVLHFTSNKNSRKQTIEEIYNRYKNNMGSSKKGTYGEYSYFIVWAINEGINSYVFNKDGKLVGNKFRYNESVKNMENITIKYINIITRKLKQISCG